MALPVANLLPAVLFWWSIFGITGLLVHLFAGHLERLLQLERGQALAVLQTLNALTINPQLEELRDRMLAVICAQLGAERISLWHYEEEKQSLTCLARSPAPPILRADSLPVAQVSFWHQLIETRRARRVMHLPGCPEYTALAPWVAGDARELLFVPLLGATTQGLLIVENQSPARFPEEQTALAEGLASQLSLVLGLIQLADREQHARIVEERNRMAREIHDTLAQGFTGIVVQLNAAQEMLRAAPEQSATHLETARQLARASLQEARRSVWALRPLSGNGPALATALEQKARLLTADAPMEIALETRGPLDRLSSDQRWEVQRVGEEALVNAVRHSGCRHLTIRLHGDPEAFRLQIEDDGRGGIPQTTVLGTHQGLGLPGMRERAERLGGQLTIESEPGRGTRVTLIVPRS